MNLLNFLNFTVNLGSDKDDLQPIDPSMSVSTRVSIAWPPTIPPSENTDTLVLSFPSSHFIDLRPLKSYDALDWGMAGYQISSETPQGTQSKSQ